jgi:uncharacterized protein YndB with AHSA1/START domain
MKSSLLMNFSVDRENQKIKVEREFAAPVLKVWAAWTESELLDQWWAPKPWRAETKTMDFKEGGYWLYAMVGPADEKHWARVDYKTIDRDRSFQAVDSFCDENGNPTDALSSMNWKNEFHATETGTKVIVEISFANEADLKKILEMGFEQGFTAALENLDALFG